ncbi:SGNH/GDSL hydrolase family protein [Nonlabens xiamenensis]|uniref:GDSL-type esterase/lipase family protein n=1 Tax=Nonlabens xiamenensis TaxID=2341043 RepID=UPI000F604CC1|nr:GDSL-type esterase/lipase family protein [Nonlabens xiamenensis]
MPFSEQKQFFSAFLILALGGLLFYVSQPLLPRKLFAESDPGAHIVMDSLMLQAMSEQEQDSAIIEVAVPVVSSDTISKPKESVVKATSAVQTQLINLHAFDFNLSHPADSTGKAVIPQPIPLSGYKGVKYLSSFFEKLYALENGSQGQVRIAYYGDSMIDGDLIVQDFRSAMQDRFGGRGVGFVPMVSESARSRYSVKHYAKGNWKEHNYMGGRSESISFGVNGGVYFAKDSTAQVKYLASGIKNAYRLNSPRLFYGPGRPDANLQLRIDKDTLTTDIPLNGPGLFNSVNLSSDNVKRVELDFAQAQDLPIYGIDFSNGVGVAVDGFSNRGNSGMPLALLNPQLMNDFDQVLGYDLIILQFGANVLSTKANSFNWYARRMIRVVEHLHQTFPKAAILILGTADKGTKNEQQVRTDSTVVRLLRSQQQYAANTQSGFLSLFHLMGGPNSMQVWTDHKLANADYTHFSPQGSRKIGRLIFQEMMLGYSDYVKAENLRQEERKKQEQLLRQQDSLKQLELQQSNDSLKPKP